MVQKVLKKRHASPVQATLSSGQRFMDLRSARMSQLSRSYCAHCLLSRVKTLGRSVSLGVLFRCLILFERSYVFRFERMIPFSGLQTNVDRDSFRFAFSRPGNQRGIGCWAAATIRDAGENDRSLVFVIPQGEGPSLFAVSGIEMPGRAVHWIVVGVCLLQLSNLFPVVLH